MKWNRCHYPHDSLKGQINKPLCKKELIDLWKKEAKQSSPGKPLGCPKATFLGICTAGYVIGIPPISYSPSIKNRLYGETAIKLLKTFPYLVNLAPSGLWNLVTLTLKASPGSDAPQKHYHQMDVILGLWKRGYIL